MHTKPHPLASLMLQTAIASAIGLVIGVIDTSKGWDDTGITVFLLIITGSFLGSLTRGNRFVIGLAFGLGVPILNILTYDNAASLPALLFGIGGVFFGSLFRPSRPTKQAS